MALLHLGVGAPRAHVVLRGSFAGPEDRASGVRTDTIGLADRAASAAELLRELEGLASRHGFVLETQPIEHGELRFYLWYVGSAAAGGGA